MTLRTKMVALNPYGRQMSIVSYHNVQEYPPLNTSFLVYGGVGELKTVF